MTSSWGSFGAAMRWERSRRSSLRRCSACSGYPPKEGSHRDHPNTRSTRHHDIATGELLPSDRSCPSGRPGSERNEASGLLCIRQEFTAELAREVCILSPGEPNVDDHEDGPQHQPNRRWPVNQPPAGDQQNTEVLWVAQIGVDPLGAQPIL